MKFYKQLSDNERFFIGISFNAYGKSISDIARELKRDKSTISREMERNCDDFGYYDPKIAIAKEYWRSKKHKHMFNAQKHSTLGKYFKKHYEKRYHGVAVTLQEARKALPKRCCLSERQVYRLINSNRWVIKKKDRLRPYYVKGRKRKVGIFTKIKSAWIIPIWMRSEIINACLEPGHFEGDLIIGVKKNGHKNIVTLNCRMTGKLFATFVDSKDPWKVNAAFRKLIKDNNLQIKSLTLDNGKEFERIGVLAQQLNFKVYVCEPYASYQRGKNENLNGMVRRTWKKRNRLQLCFWCRTSWCCE